MDDIIQQQTLLMKIGRFYNECKRILQITKKPDKFEYKSIVKASALGIAVIGGLGFIIYLLKVLILG